MSESEIPHETPGERRRRRADRRARGSGRAAAERCGADAGQPRPRTRKLAWAGVALLCTAAGVVGSVLGAHAVANSDSSKGRQSAQQSAAAIAATVKLSLRHEEDIAVGAATYFAGNSKTSPKEFATWVKWARTLRRFPELEGLSLLTLVHPNELAAFQARITGQKLKPAARTPATQSLGPLALDGNGDRVEHADPRAGEARAARLRVIPASNHAYYCLAVANLVRGPAKAPRAGTDYCALTPGLLLTRDSGQSTYRTVSVDGTQALAIDVPVYRGNVTPHSVFGRTAASVGWLREVLAPSVMLREALRGHESSAVEHRLPDGVLESRLRQRHRTARLAEHHARAAQRLDGSVLLGRGHDERAQRRSRASAADRRLRVERDARHTDLRARRRTHAAAGARASAAGAGEQRARPRACTTSSPGCPTAR